MARLGWVWCVVPLGALAGCGAANVPDCPPEDLIPVFLDEDGDGRGGSPEGSACALEEGQVSLGGDCDDTDATVHADAEELCDLRDNDCDGLVDEGMLKSVWYPDLDADTYGDSDAGEPWCRQPGPSWTPVPGDCDDTNDQIHPLISEVCNDGVDDDCDGFADDLDESLDMTTQQTFYADVDQDGFGDPEAPVVQCAWTAAVVENSDDCNDGDPLVNPDAQEVCDTIDNDCDTLVDIFDLDSWHPLNGDTSVLDPSKMIELPADADCDGYGSLVDIVLACGPQPCFAAALANDCDDTDSWVNVEQDWFTDMDQDGVGAGEPVLVDQCSRPAPDGDGKDLAPEAHGVDCDDQDSGVNPLHPEVCGDGKDQDCDGADDVCP